MRSIVGAIFTAVFTAEVSNEFPQKLSDIAIPAITSAGLPTSSVPDLLVAITAGTEEALSAVLGMNDGILAVTSTKVSEAYAAAYAYPYYTALALALASVIAAIGIRDFDHYLTDHVSRQIYKKDDTGKDILQLVNYPDTEQGGIVTELKSTEKDSNDLPAQV